MGHSPGLQASLGPSAWNVWSIEPLENNLVGGFNLPLWKWWSESQLGWWNSMKFHEIPNMMGKIKNVPNHQPVYDVWMVDFHCYVWLPEAPNMTIMSWLCPLELLNCFLQLKQATSMVLANVSNWGAPTLYANPLYGYQTWLENPWTKWGCVKTYC